MLFRSNLGGPVQTVVLDDSYHIVTLDRQRELVLQRTLDFLSHATWKPVSADECTSLSSLLDGAGS